MKVFLIVALMAVATQAGRIDPKLKARLANGEVLDVVIQLPDIGDVFTSPSVLNGKSIEARTNTMISMLKERTAASRQPFVNILTSLKLHHQRSIVDPVWISNNFEVKDVDYSLADVLSRVPGDFLIREEKVAHIIGPVDTHEVSAEELRQDNLQWGVRMIKANEVWNMTRGEGVVVGIIDTGVHLVHEAVQAAYGGPGGWLDPYYSRPEPNDVQSHGTHCIGTVLGSTNGIGVAPGAKWVACRGLNDQGSGTETNLRRCAQFMLNGSDPKPHVITNSWGGGSNDDWYDAEMRAWMVAGMIPVFALGNSGPSCMSANSPGDRLYCIGVGATTSTDTIASFSSRGPTPSMMKPELSAPGDAIISAGNTGNSSYTSKSGTSMATPHVAGAVALLLSHDPTLTFNQIKAMLQMGDRPPVDSSTITCSGGTEWPNTAFGHGRINVVKALGLNATDSTIYF